MSLEGILRFTDFATRKCVQKFYFADGDVELPNAAMTAITNQINLVSDCQITSQELIGADDSITGTAADGSYNDSSDKVRFQMRGTTTGSNHFFDFPCPKASIFQTDNETADPDNDAVSGMVDWIVENAAGTGSEPLAFVKAFRVKMPKK